MTIVKKVEVDGKTIEIEVGRLAKQANGTAFITCGGTQVLVTVCAASEAKEGQDFFPLTVDYIEKFYATGRIPGGYLKREGKPSDREILTARVIDRPLRPSFPSNYLCDTFVSCFVYSYDGENHPAPLALLGASTALMISDVPFNGPIAALRIGMDDDGNFFNDPDHNNPGKLELNIAASPEAILMVEAGADFISEEKMLSAIEYAHENMKPLFEIQLELQKEIGKEKRTLAESYNNSEVRSAIESEVKASIEKALTIKDKLERYAAIKEVTTPLHDKHNPDGDAQLKIFINEVIDELKSNAMRQKVVKESVRIDGRSPEEIRPISCELKVLKRAHGSAVFTRGETQALGVATLGAAEDAQRLDTILQRDENRRFMLHYNFPPLSVGEARPMRPPGRREIGHGALAERALERVIPDFDKFGYTIRLVSEVLESNGSSSMATVCAGTMALLDAGVPIKAPVAGIAMGLIMEESGEYAILSDILGDEDHLGDMDFKVCGNEDGITALQMDIKISGLSKEILAKALDQAKSGRSHILSKVVGAISKPEEISEHAPRIFSMSIKPDKIRDLIGPGGKNIRSVTADTGVKIDIEDDGTVKIMSSDAKSAEEAKQRIRQLTTDPEVNEVYMGKIKKVVDFGCFVEIKPGTEGLCHISQLEDRRIENVYDHYSEGMEIMVKVIDIDHSGRIKLSRKAAMEGKS